MCEQTTVRSDPGVQPDAEHMHGALWKVFCRWLLLHQISPSTIWHAILETEAFSASPRIAVQPLLPNDVPAPVPCTTQRE